MTLNAINSTLLGGDNTYIHIYYTSHNALQKYNATSDNSLCWLVRRITVNYIQTNIKVQIKRLIYPGNSKKA